MAIQASSPSSQKTARVRPQYVFAMKKIKVAPGQQKKELVFHLVGCKHCKHIGWWGRKQAYVAQTKKPFVYKTKAAPGQLSAKIKRPLYIVLGQREGYRCPKCRSIQGVTIDPLRYAISVSWGAWLIGRALRGVRIDLELSDIRREKERGASMRGAHVPP